MLLRSISLLCLVLSLTNCSRPHATYATEYTVAPIQRSMQPRLVEPFTRVVVNGNIDVTLYTGDPHPRVILQGDARNLSDVQTTVRDGLLYVNIGKGYPHLGRVHADIRTRYLTSFAYHGAGKVTADNLQSGMLDLSIDNKNETRIKGNIALRKLIVAGSGDTQISGIKGRMCQIKLTGSPRVKLAGIIDITSLNMAGKSFLSLYWVNANVLKIRAKDKAFIQMAGVVETLDLALDDHARFNGQYLRGTDVFVKTFGHARADISAIKTQHTLASGASNIYFHNLPKMKADFMAWNGAVLDLRNWNSPDFQEGTRFNR